MTTSADSAKIKERIIALYKEGKYQAAIAKMVGVTRQYVHIVLKDAGLKS